MSMGKSIALKSNQSYEVLLPKSTELFGYAADEIERESKKSLQKVISERIEIG